jgi:hypothetical protein
MPKTDVITPDLAGVSLHEILPPRPSVFASEAAEAWSHRFEGELFLKQILGGVPSDPRVVEGWLRTKLGIDKEQQIQRAVLEIVEKRGITKEEATAELAATQNLNGFYRTRCKDCLGDGPICSKPDAHQLYIEGRQLKAALKEAASVAVAAGRLDGRGWGKTNKGLLNFMAEHVMVVEDHLDLWREDGSPVTSPDKVNQHFVNTRFGSAIQYQEMVQRAVIKFTVISDYDFTEKQWAQIWVGGEQQGLGASRSQTYGRYTVTRWDRVS